ncbi:hypothetical protein KM043_003162 [Ampulex compressa]|nr:hypothetical protein KM043_003162 [Ampulex compressa]
MIHRYNSIPTSSTLDRPPRRPIPDLPPPKPLSLFKVRATPRPAPPKQRAPNQETGLPQLSSIPQDHEIEVYRPSMSFQITITPPASRPSPCRVLAGEKSLEKVAEVARGRAEGVQGRRGSKQRSRGGSARIPGPFLAHNPRPKPVLALSSASFSTIGFTCGASSAKGGQR